MIPAGRRDQRITFQKATVVNDDYGGETETWTDHAAAWARVRFGRADEKRQAAQESGVQAATFEMTPDSKLRQVTIRDRIVFAGANWDITEAALLAKDVMRFTATRSV